MEEKIEAKKEEKKEEHEHDHSKLSKEELLKHAAEEHIQPFKLIKLEEVKNHN